MDCSATLFRDHPKRSNVSLADAVWNLTRPPVARRASNCSNVLRQHFSEVREIYERLLAAETQPETPAPPLESESETGPGALLRRIGADWPIVAHAYDEIAHGGDAHARRGILNYLTSASLDAALMNDLAENPGWLSRAATLFTASDFAAEWLVREPHLIRVVAAEDRNATQQPPIQHSIFPRDMNSVRQDYHQEVFISVIECAKNCDSAVRNICSVHRAR